MRDLKFDERHQIWWETNIMSGLKFCYSFMIFVNQIQKLTKYVVPETLIGCLTFLKRVKYIKTA